jgi:hypothetical protein
MNAASVISLFLPVQLDKSKQAQFLQVYGENRKFQEYRFLHPEHAKTRLRVS